MAEQIDEHSATWRAVKAHASRRLEDSRAALEAPGQDLARTEFERGRIAYAKELLELERKITPADSSVDE